MSDQQQNDNGKDKTTKSKQKQVKNELLQKDANELKHALLFENQEKWLENYNDSEHPLESFNEIISGPIAGSIIRSIHEMGIQHPSKIQYKTIPILNDSKKNLIAQSPSGTGKTIAFLISMLLHIDPTIKLPQTICLSPTNQLVLQTFDTFTKLNSHLNYKGSVCLNNQNPSNDSQLLFGTPSSIDFFIKNKIIKDTSKINFLVIDEVDEILMQQGSHFKYVKELFKIIPKKTQYCYFSTTLKNNTLSFIQQKHERNLFKIILKRRNQCPPTIEHWYTHIKDKNEGKNSILELVKNVGGNGQTLIFTTNKNSDDLSNFLKENKINCDVFTSQISKEKGDSSLISFKNGDLKVLITNDVLSFGIDIPNISLVINFDLPVRSNLIFNKGKKTKQIIPDCDAYLNRAGRTGRFGRFGICFTILKNEKEEDILKSFCSSKNLDIPLIFIDKDQINNLSETVVKESNQPRKIITSSYKKPMKLFEYKKDGDEKKIDNEYECIDDGDDDYDENFVDEGCEDDFDFNDEDDE